MSECEIPIDKGFHMDKSLEIDKMVYYIKNI